MKRDKKFDRRSFLKTSAIGAAGLSLVANAVTDVAAEEVFSLPESVSPRRIIPLNHNWLYSEKSRSIWRNIFSRKKDQAATTPRELIWVNQLKEWQKEIGRDDQEFVEGLKIEFFKNHIFAFTPKGDIIELPEEATPIDFAYAIHSEIGNRAVGAKVNGKIVPLNHQIENAEVIEILTVKEKKKPSRDWLDFVKTSGAKSHIRRELRGSEFGKE